MYIYILCSTQVLFRCCCIHGSKRWWNHHSLQESSMHLWLILIINNHSQQVRFKFQCSNSQCTLEKKHQVKHVISCDIYLVCWKFIPMVVMWWLAPPILSRGLQFLLLPPKQWMIFFSSGKFHPPGCPPRDPRTLINLYIQRKEQLVQIQNLAITSSCCRVSNNNSTYQPFLIWGMLIALTSFWVGPGRVGYMWKTLHVFSQKIGRQLLHLNGNKPKKRRWERSAAFPIGESAAYPGNF